MMCPYRREDVGDVRTYSLAQKFFRFRKVEKEYHNIPRYSLGNIKDLANLMYKSFLDYSGKSSDLQKELRDAQNKLLNMENDLQLNELEQEKYFQMENGILEEIYQSGSTNWKWSFEHRLE